MKYIFIFNGLPDRAWVIDEVSRQIDAAGLDCIKYVTTDAGDATRYVNLTCDLNPKEEICFVACGGAGLTNEVMTGIVQRENKHMAILFYAGTNDFVKVYPDRNFQSLDDLLNGERTKIDVIKVNDNYSMNVVNFGMDATITALGQENIAMNIPNPYANAVKHGVIFSRIHKIKIYADGKKVNRRLVMNVQVANGNYTGGEYKCAPYASVDDGWLDLSYFIPIPVTVLALIMPHFRDGTYLEDKFCKHFCHYRRAKHIEIRSDDLILIALDGENLAAESVDIDVVPKALNLILPRK